MQITSVSLIKIVEKDILSTCRRRLPYETCGVLYGTEIKNDEIYNITVDGFSLIRNTSESATTSFAFHPEDWVDAYFYAQKNQRNIVGLFHSHPQGTASPSIQDKEGSIPWRTYWIISLTEGQSTIAAYERNTHNLWRSLPLLRDM